MKLHHKTEPSLLLWQFGWQREHRYMYVGPQHMLQQTSQVFRAWETDNLICRSLCLQFNIRGLLLERATLAHSQLF